mmetsp:Transcript_7532/g.12657  ORF Transcript_7532/g.12657 Transcript_7532/m.12657 type:complete len:214 (-) Transcript_7532:123-764(-)
MSAGLMKQALRPLQTQLYGRSISHVKVFARAMPQHTYYAKRMVSERSFAEERLKEMGESLDPAPDEGAIEVDLSNIDAPNARVQKIVDEVLDLNIIEVNMFFKAIQRRLGVSDEFLSGAMGGGGGGQMVPDAEEAAVEEVVVKDVFEVKLKAFDPKSKIKIIKEVRALTGLGLKEAKELVEKAPVIVKDGLTKDDAAALEKTLVELGAEVEIL